MKCIREGKRCVRTWSRRAADSLMEGNFINSVPRAVYHNNTKETHVVSDEMKWNAATNFMRVRAPNYTHRVKSISIDDFFIYAPIDDRKSSGTHERLILFTHTSCTRRTQSPSCLHEFPTGTSLRIAVSPIARRTPREHAAPLTEGASSSFSKSLVLKSSLSARVCRHDWGILEYVPTYSTQFNKLMSVIPPSLSHLGWRRGGSFPFPSLNLNIFICAGFAFLWQKLGFSYSR